MTGTPTNTGLPGIHRLQDPPRILAIAKLPDGQLRRRYVRIPAGGAEVVAVKRAVRWRRTVAREGAA